MERHLMLLAMAAAAATLLLSFNGVDAFWRPYYSVTTMHVGGKVLCQDCTKGWNHWAHGATPLNGSKVSVRCTDERKRIIYYATDLTDAQGEFDLLVKKVVYGKKIKPEWCTVKLVYSPDPACDIATNFGSGKSGVILRRPSIVYPKLVRYTVGPFYYTSPMCDEPDTSVPLKNNRPYGN